MTELTFSTAPLRSDEHVFIGAQTSGALRERAAGRLQHYIDNGIQRATSALETIERDIPSDTVIGTDVLGVESTESGLDLMIRPQRQAPGALLDAIITGQDQRRRLHDNAIAQAAGRVGLPLGYANDLQGTEWGNALLAQILTTHFTEDPSRVLVRCVRESARAFLSDSYRRLDARPIIGSFVSAASDLGAVVCDGLITDLRVRVSAVMPTVMWINGDPVVFGVSLTTSDFGRGRLLLSAFTLRLLCLNGATGESYLRQVHLGGKLPSDLRLSERTYALDTETTASAVHDILKLNMTPEVLGVRAQKVADAQAVKVQPDQTLPLLKKSLSHAEHDGVTHAFMFGADDVVPSGANAWRLSQAISYVAGQAKRAERRLDLERFAGAILDNPTARIAALVSSVEDEVRVAA